MSEPIHQYVIQQLQLAKGQWPKVAEKTGVSLRTIEKVARQESKDPAISTVETLYHFFKAEPFV